MSLQPSVAQGRDLWFPADESSRTIMRLHLSDSSRQLPRGGDKGASRSGPNSEGKDESAHSLENVAAVKPDEVAKAQFKRSGDKGARMSPR